MQNRGNNMPGLGGGNSNYNSPQQQSYPGQSAMMSSPTKSYGNNAGNSNPGNNNNRSFQPNNAGSNSYSSPSNDSFKAQWDNNNNNMGGNNNYSPSHSNPSNSSNFSSPNNSGNFDRFQPPSLQNTQSAPYNPGNPNDRSYSGNNPGYPGSPMQNNDRGFGSNERGYGANNSDSRGFGNNPDNFNNNANDQRAFAHSSSGNPNAFPGQGSLGGIGSNAMGGGGIGSNAMGGGGVGSKLFGSDNNPSSPSFLSGGGGLGGGNTGPKKDIAEKASDLLDMGKLKISESKRLVIGGLTKLGVVKDDTPEALKRLIMEIEMVNKQFEVLADLSKKMWSQTEFLIDSRKQLATFFYSTGCKETEPISANLQEVGLLYQQLEYNDKLILLHLSDTMRDIEFFRQNIIGDALASVQKTQTARANWLNMLDAQGTNASNSSGSGLQNNIKRQLQELEARYNDCFSQLEIKVMLLKDKRSVELSAKFMASGKAWALYHSNLSEHLQLVDSNIVCEETQDFRELMVNIHS